MKTDIDFCLLGFTFCVYLQMWDTGRFTFCVYLLMRDTVLYAGYKELILLPFVSVLHWCNATGFSDVIPGLYWCK